MDKCPFCHGAVPRDLTLHGGPCPHCFASIPGEETPTDPGEQVKKAIAEQDKRHAEKRSRGPVFAVGAMAAVAIVFSAYIAWPKPKVVVVTFDEANFEMSISPSPEVASAGTTNAGGDTKSNQGSARPRSSEPATSGVFPVGGPKDDGAAAANPSAADISAALGGAGSARAPESSVRSPNAPLSTIGASPSTGSVDMGSAAAGGFGAIDAPTAGPQRRSVVLTEPTQISGAFKKMVRAKSGGTKSCYERQLKINEDLKGSWRVKVTIAPDGRVTARSATGPTSVPDMEACIVQKVSTWQADFNLERSMDVEFPISFSAE